MLKFLVIFRDLRFYYIFTLHAIIAEFLTLYPEDLKWHPLLVSVLFILTQKARSIPRYSDPLAARLICADTVDKESRV